MPINWDKFTDYSGKMCDLNPIKGEWPMYSYERAAWNFWNGIANGLKDQGFSESEIGEWLRSKYARWMLDNHSDKLIELGYKLSQGQSKVE